MADNRMKHDDQQRNMGAGGRDDKDAGKQAPGRSDQGGQQPGQQGQKRNVEDDDESATGGQTGGKNPGGQNR